MLTSKPPATGKQEEHLRRQDPSPGATAKPSPVVEGASAARAAELVAALLKRGDDHGNVLRVVGNNRKELAALAEQHGERLFCRACDAFLKESPWNERTMAPYKMLVDGFESYIGQVERIDKQKRDDDHAAEQGKIITHYYPLGHSLRWLSGGEDYKKYLDKLSPDERVMVEHVAAGKYDSLDKYPAYKAAVDKLLTMMKEVAKAKRTGDEQGPLDFLE